MAKKNKEQVFHKDMTIEEIVSLFPESASLLLAYGLHCIGCYATAFETLEQGVLGHGYGDEELENLIQELNESYARTRRLSSSRVRKEKQNDFHIMITPKALRAISSIAKEQGKEMALLRLDVTPTSEALKYQLHFEEEGDHSDQDVLLTYEDGKIRLITSGKHTELINGLEIDYVKKNNQSGFTMNNPRDKSSREKKKG